MRRLQIYNFETLSSTNDKAKEFAKQGKYNLVIIAKEQKKGRGRFGRKWISDYNGLCMTILLKEEDINKTKYLTFIAGISVARAIIDICSLNAKVKWPNDVLINDKKVCGILTETIHGKENYVLVGIGLNVNNKDFSKSISDKATSLALESNKEFGIKILLNRIIKNFIFLYRYYTNKNYVKIIDLWKKYSHTVGKRIKAKTLDGEFIGKAIDIDDECYLVLRLDNGEIKKIIEGDIFI